MTVEIRHDGAGEFTFPNSGNLERAAVVGADSTDLIVEYQFSKISGGSVLKRTVGTLPGPAEVSFGSAATLAGNATVGSTLTATGATYTGGVGTVSTNLIIQVSDSGSGGWSFKAGNPDTPSGGTASYTVAAGDDGKYLRASYQVTDDNGTHTSNSNVIGPALPLLLVPRLLTSATSTPLWIDAELPERLCTQRHQSTPAVSMSAGETAAFDFSGVASAHPLGIFTDSTKSTPYTNGVETGGTGVRCGLFAETAGTFSYQCINHANMGGDITVS